MSERPIRVPMDRLLKIRDALEAGRVLATEKYEAAMADGVFNKGLYDGMRAFEEAQITLRVWILDKAPAVELEVA